MIQERTNEPERKTNTSASDFDLLTAIAAVALATIATKMLQGYNHVPQNEATRMFFAVVSGGLVWAFYRCLAPSIKCLKRKLNTHKNLIVKSLLIAACVWVLFSLWHPK